MKLNGAYWRQRMTTSAFVLCALRLVKLNPELKLEKNIKLIFCQFQPSLMKLSPLVEGEETGSKEEIRTPKRDDPDKK